MSLGLLDLSIVTDRLLKILDDEKNKSNLWTENTTTGAHTAAPFAITFTGLPPNVTQHLSGCHVSMYLFHVAPDKFYRNTFPLGGEARLIPEQPLALTLYYLLPVHSN